MPEKIKCHCPCHKDKSFKHIQPCCKGGYIYLMTDEEMRSHSLAILGEQILKQNKIHGCKG